MSSEKQPGTRLAILVTGPPSSGNRWVASIITACGVFGYGSSDQPHHEDLVLWSLHDKIVLVVHNGLEVWIQTLRDLDYDVRAVVVVRDPYCTRLSQKMNGHATFHASSQDVLLPEMRALVSFGVPWNVWPYEALISRHEARQAMCRELGLELQGQVEVRDGNDRYYSDPEGWRAGLVP